MLRNTFCKVYNVKHDVTWFYGHWIGYLLPPYLGKGTHGPMEPQTSPVHTALTSSHDKSFTTKLSGSEGH